MFETFFAFAAWLMITPVDSPAGVPPIGKTVS
jgi:hypothetical protein